MKSFKVLRLLCVIMVGLAIGGCEPQVYGSVGVSKSSWSGGSGRYGSVSVGGRIR